MATFNNDEWSTDICRKLVKRYKDEFGFIESEHIICVKDETSAHSRFYAATSLIPAQLRPLTPYRILIRTNVCNFDQVTRNARIMILKHELTHVGEKSSGDYKLVHHDVEDFASFLQEFGIGWATRKDIPNILAKGKDAIAVGRKIT
jgi:predicted metallopeptidase